MKKCAKCLAVMPIDSFYIERARPDGRGSYCKECSKKAQRDNYAKNPERNKVQCRQWRKDNVSRHRFLSNKWRTENKQRDNKNSNEWRKKNPQFTSATNANRRAAKLRAAPAWRNHFFISEAYDLAKRRTQAFGYRWVVDHVVPLISESVCGLHVEHNLNVIPETHNTLKGNFWWPDMPIDEVIA